jgi:predicted transcriptional regulator
MTSKRSKLEIYLVILRTIKQGVEKPTNIMYRCNLAWKPFKKILKALVESSLIKIIDRGNRKTYELTPKGLEVLKYFEAAETILAELKEPKKADSDTC